MENWYFIEYHCKEKAKNFLKESESDRIAGAIKKRDTKKFYFPLTKMCLFLFKSIFYFIRKKEIDIEL